MGLEGPKGTGHDRGDIPLMGGVLGLECARLSHAAAPPFLRGQLLTLVNVRSCLYMLIRELKPKRVWLPGYLCDSIVQAAQRAGAQCRFYALDYSLRPTTLDWLKEVQPGDLVLVIAYFGFPADRAICQAAKQRGAVVALDASQALLEQDDVPVDCALYNPRKFLGVPDGGVLQLRADLPMGKVSVTPPDDRWWLDALDALLLRRDFDHGDDNREWFPRFRAVETAQPVGALAMSELTHRILRWGVDYEELARRRRVNFQALTNELGDIAIFSELPDGVVPLGFPVRVAHRAEVLAKLYAKQIYPPVHWPVPAAVPSDFRDARRLADDIMTLPCDQRYTTDHMLHMARALRETLA